MARRKLVAGNWKMNGLRAESSALTEAILARSLAEPSTTEILLCPPVTLLTTIAALLTGSGIELGGQDCHDQPSGAFTGDVSAAMLRDAGCSHVILGHSERRAGHGETDAVVRAKAEAALAAGLTVILCVGETEAEHDAEHTLDVVDGQIRRSMPTGADPTNLVIAYEPIWAIGTGRIPTLAEIEAVHGHVRALVAGLIPGGGEVRLLYGGSVKPSNARDVLALADVDGALVGGASLVAEDFWGIIGSA